MTSYCEKVFRSNFFCKNYFSPQNHNKMHLRVVTLYKVISWENEKICKLYFITTCNINFSRFSEKKSCPFGNVLCN